MFDPRVAFVLSVALALPSLCRADYTLTFLDNTETLRETVNGVDMSSTDCSSIPFEVCINTLIGLDLAAPAQYSFNIFEQDGTLSDTLRISVETLRIQTAFQSDSGGVPLVLLTAGTVTDITENGLLQPDPAFEIPLATGGNYVVQFESDLDPAPEPRWGVLLTLAVLGIALVTKRFVRKLS
jgi:hypothetical protein